MPFGSANIDQQFTEMFYSLFYKYKEIHTVYVMEFPLNVRDVMLILVDLILQYRSVCSYADVKHFELPLYMKSAIRWRQRFGSKLQNENTKILNYY